MRILFLGYQDSPLIDFFLRCGDSVIRTMEEINKKKLLSWRPNFIVSYGYRYILKHDIVKLYRDKIINLHISFLPWNRGADPNFWSWVDDTPKGVTIHYIDEGIDTGDIIVRKKVMFGSAETLKSSYWKLRQAVERMFMLNWHKIKTGECSRKKQEGRGSYHNSKEKEYLFNQLPKGYDTPVAELKELILSET